MGPAAMVAQQLRILRRENRALMELYADRLRRDATAAPMLSVHRDIDRLLLQHLVRVSPRVMPKEVR